MAAKNARSKRKCKNKVAYERHTDAIKSVVSLKKNGKLGFKYNIYICPICNKYHIGHRPRKYTDL